MEMFLLISFVISIIFFIIDKKKYHLLLAEKNAAREKVALLDKKERQCAALQQELVEWRVRYAAIETTLREREDFYQKKIAEIGNVTTFCKESFRALSIETLSKNNQAFLELASAKLEKYQKEIQMKSSHNENTVKSLFLPICEQLEKMQEEMKKLEFERKIDHTKIQTQLSNMIESERELQKETSNLKKVFRSPNLRGRWGEIQLKRVLEIVGMRPYCDFEEQTSLRGEFDISRPDVIIRLPDNRSVIIDAKVPLGAYMEAIETDDAVIEHAKLQEHAKSLRRHIDALGKKEYWKKITPSPEFVVLFLPSEVLFHSALQVDPGLIELGAKIGVVFATPATLIGLLRIIAYGWQQETLAQNTKRIQELGKELQDRLIIFTKHMAKIGQNLHSSVHAYNDAVGSLESRVFPSAKRLQEVQGSSSNAKVIPSKVIEEMPRKCKATDLP
ncbi:MAG: DNA recombination protein RmuC [Chlamydiales bacterium]